MKDIEKDKNQKQNRAISNNLETTSENKGLSMMPPPFQFKSMQGEEEKGKKPTIQKKSNPNGMPEKVQTKMENAFGQDFSNVNIHTNSGSAKDMGALAYAQGNDVYFASGQYNPESSKGQELIGHELTHVVQQREGRVKPTVQGKGMPINDSPVLEKEADVMGAKAARGNIQMKKNKGSISDNLHNTRTSIQAKSSIIQFSLNTDLTELLNVYGPVHYEGVISVIRNAPVSERQIAVASNTILTLIRTRLNPAYASAAISELLVGSQNWANPPATDFYTYFVLNKGNGSLPTNHTMNCWESILYSAYLANALSANWIRNYYISAGAVPDTTTDPTPNLWAQLGFSTTLPTYDPANENIPAFGQLIFYVQGSSPIPGHVAVYVGNNEVISLWTQPNNINEIQRISITALSGTIHYGDTPW